MGFFSFYYRFSSSFLTRDSLVILGQVATWPVGGSPRPCSHTPWSPSGTACGEGPTGREKGTAGGGREGSGGRTRFPPLQNPPSIRQRKSEHPDLWQEDSKEQQTPQPPRALSSQPPRWLVLLPGPSSHPPRDSLLLVFSVLPPMMLLPGRRLAFPRPEVMPQALRPPPSPSPALCLHPQNLGSAALPVPWAPAPQHLTGLRQLGQELARYLSLPPLQDQAHRLTA